MTQTDFLVIGSGVAGMWFALKAARHGRVTVLTKRAVTQSNSAHAQGGIAATWHEADDPEHHIQDTLVCVHASRSLPCPISVFF